MSMIKWEIVHDCDTDKAKIIAEWPYKLYSVKYQGKISGCKIMGTNKNLPWQ